MIWGIWITQEITQGGGGETEINIEKSRSSRLYFRNAGDGHDCGRLRNFRQNCGGGAPAEIGRVDTSANNSAFLFPTFLHFRGYSAANTKMPALFLKYNTSKGLMSNEWISLKATRTKSYGCPWRGATPGRNYKKET